MSDEKDPLIVAASSTLSQKPSYLSEAKFDISAYTRLRDKLEDDLWNYDSYRIADIALDALSVAVSQAEKERPNPPELSKLRSIMVDLRRLMDSWKH